MIMHDNVCLIACNSKNIFSVKNYKDQKNCIYKQNRIFMIVKYYLAQYFHKIILKIFLFGKNLLHFFYKTLLLFMSLKKNCYLKKLKEKRIND